jgi:hypothetical protein
MRFMIATAVALVLGSGAALADSKPTAEEAAKIKEAVAAWGCEGGEYEKETEAYGVYEAEDVKCKAGQFDFRLNKEFKVFVITAD